MSEYRGDGSHTVESTLFMARAIAVGMAASLLILAVASGWMPRESAAGFLVGPVAIFGIVSLVIGYRMFQWIREKVPSAAGSTQRHAHFLRATVLSLAVTDGAAVLGVVVFALTDELSALIGMVSHTILTGALWPTEDKLKTFLTPGPAASFNRE